MKKFVKLQHDGGHHYVGTVMPDTGIDEEVAREAYKEYVAQGHGDQSFELLHERGGFGCKELAQLLFERIKRLEQMWEQYMGADRFKREFETTFISGNK